MAITARRLAISEPAKRASRKLTPEPFTAVVFGASGDLTRRKLVPALYGLFREGLLPDGFSLVGFARPMTQ